MWNKLSNVWDARGFAPLRCRFSTMARAGGPGRALGAPRCCCPGWWDSWPALPLIQGHFPKSWKCREAPTLPFFFWPFLLWSLTGNTAVVEDVSHAYVAFINNECVLWIISFWRGTWEFRLTIRVSQLLLKWEFWLNQEICSPPQDVCAPDDIYTPLFALFYYADFLGLRCM